MKGLFAGSSDNLFITINKFLGPGKYKPVYKSECKTPMGGAYNFNIHTIDTDTLAENRDDQDILFQVWLHKISGNHKKFTQGQTNLAEMKAGG